MVTLDTAALTTRIETDAPQPPPPAPVTFKLDAVRLQPGTPAAHERHAGELSSPGAASARAT